MGIYAHRCNACGHLSYEHDLQRNCCWRYGCACPEADFGPTEVIPTFNANGEVAAHAPGDGIRAQAKLASGDPDPATGRWIYETPGQVIVASCNCNECVVAHSELSA